MTSSNPATNQARTSVDRYIDAMERRAGAAHYGTTLFNTEGFPWLRIGLAERNADTIQRGVDIAFAWQDGFPGLGQSLLKDYQEWEKEAVNE